LDPQSDESRLAEFIDINITTGVGALSKQRSMIRFVTQGLGTLQQLDPRLRVNGVNAADRIAEGMLIDTEGLYEEIPAEEMGAPPGADAETPAREETVMTAGGPQPPQPPQPGRPR